MGGVFFCTGDSPVVVVEKHFIVVVCLFLCCRCCSLWYTLCINFYLILFCVLKSLRFGANIKTIKTFIIVSQQTM
jgi:hypothetical protein